MPSYATLLTTVSALTNVPVFLGTVAGVVLGDLVTLEVASNGQLVTDPVTDLGLTLVEVSAGSAPGFYFLQLTPVDEGALAIRFSYGGTDYEYMYQVSPDLQLFDAELEGEHVFTEEDGVSVVQGAVVRVFDAAGTRFITRGVTDALGHVTFTLPIGNYQVRVFKDGFDFSAINPTTIAVTPTASAAPILTEVLPVEASIGDTIALVGHLFDETSEVMFGAEDTVAADYVNPAGTVILVTVPTLTGTTFALRADKLDPANPLTGRLISNSVTWVRV